MCYTDIKFYFQHCFFILSIFSCQNLNDNRIAYAYSYYKFMKTM